MMRILRSSRCKLLEKTVKISHSPGLKFDGRDCCRRPDDRDCRQTVTKLHTFHRSRDFLSDVPHVPLTRRRNRESNCINHETAQTCLNRGRSAILADLKSQ